MEEDGMLDPGHEGHDMVGMSSALVGAFLPVDDSTMEDIIDKLKMLNFETGFSVRHSQFRISRTYFSRPHINSSEQFFAFTSLVAWLLSLTGVSFPAPSQFDDASASATSIIGALRALGLNVKDIAPSKLRSGHGEAVLHVLNLLCDKALLASGFQFRTPEWMADKYDDEMEINEGPTDDAAEDAASEADDDDAGAEDLLMDETSAMKEAIVPEADPQEWAEEAARVAPLLKLQWKNEFRDWRAHLAWTQTLLKTIEKTFPGVKVALEGTCDGISKAVETIQKREQGLMEQCTSKIEEYRSYKKEYGAVADKYKASADIVDALSNELNKITEELESLKAEIAGREEVMQDTSSVGKIKEAMAAIKTEINDMELKIGVYQHRMMHYLLKNPGKRTLEALADDASDAEQEDWK